MRYLYALIVSTGLCVVPSVGLAATDADTASRAAAAANPAPASERSSADEPARAADRAGDQARYAEREAQSGEAQEYRGGDTVVIGASAATAILAVLLLIVLI
jgi:hypothetical protein